MRADLDDKLCQDFPLLFRDRHASMQTTCLCWGFDVGDGWYDIVYRLSTKLEDLIRKEETWWFKTKAYASEFWWRVVKPIFRLQRPMWHFEIPQYKAVQVKEKFSGLRFYLTYSTDAMDAAIREAEEEASRTCEECGEPGVCRQGGWLRTLCNEHAEGRKPYDAKDDPW